MPTDHRLVLGELIDDGSRGNAGIARSGPPGPLQQQRGGTRKKGDSHFTDLNRGVKKPSWKGRTTMALCISYAIWRLANNMVALERKLTTYQRERRTLTLRFQAALKENSVCRARKAGEEVKALVANNQLQ